MRVWIRNGLLGCGIVCSALYACTYGPHPKEGAEQCYTGTKQCPDGYVCSPVNNMCYTPANLPPTNGYGHGGGVGTGGPGQGGIATPGAGGRTGTGGTIGTTPGAGGLVGTGGPGGGSAGAPGTGGVASTGGATACTPTKATGSYPLIDDMSDGDGGIPPQDGRSGGWFTFNDGSGVQLPSDPGALAATPGWICTSGSGFITWGAGLGVTLDSDTSGKSCNYDGSVYKGVTFKIQGTVTGGRVRFGILTSDIAAAATTNGGTCVSSSTLANDCDDAYGVWLTPISFASTTGFSCFNGSSQWSCATATSAGSVAVTIPFSSMVQEGWGRSIPFDLAHMLHLDWQAKDYCSDPATGVTSYLGPTSFNFCIGNLSFY